MEQRIVDAILKGNLEDLKNLRLSRFDVNKPLKKFDYIRPIAKYTPTNNYMPLKGPNILILATYCEQDEIVKYILQGLTPDLSFMCDGMNAFHCSCVTKDHKCFDLLLRCQYFQENIDAPTQNSGTSSHERGPTALHIATTNKNYYQVDRLLSPLPDVIFKIQKDSDSMYDDDNMDYPSANVNAITTISGSTPLRIAFHNLDVDMCRLLLAHDADPDYGEKKARDMLKLNIRKMEESIRKLKCQGKDRSESSRRNLAEKETLLENYRNLENDCDNPPNLSVVQLDLHISEMKADIVIDDSDDEAQKEGEGLIIDNSDNSENEELDDILDFIARIKSEAAEGDEKAKDSLSKIIESLRDVMSTTIAIDPNLFASVNRVYSCEKCGQVASCQCSLCQKWFCDVCMKKPHGRGCSFDGINK